MTVPILILAGGASSRMGTRDKMAETVGGQPLLRLQAERALEVSSDATVLLRPGKPALEKALQDLPIRLLVSDDALEGIGGSLRAGTAAHRDAACLLVMLADLVEIEPNDLRTVIAARSEGGDSWIWRGATEDGKPGHPILFDRAVFDELLKLHGDEGGQQIMKAHPEKVRLVPLPGQRARCDLDTPEEWDAWRARQGVDGA